MGDCNVHVLFNKGISWIVIDWNANFILISFFIFINTGKLHFYLIKEIHILYTAPAWICHILQMFINIFDIISKYRFQLNMDAWNAFIYYIKNVDPLLGSFASSKVFQRAMTWNIEIKQVKTRSYLGFTKNSQYMYCDTTDLICKCHLGQLWILHCSFFAKKLMY